MGTKILVVDDEPRILQLIGSRLKAGGFEAVLLESGRACLESVSKEKPDLILLDILMPDIDGYETLKKLQENDETKTIPVVVISATGMRDDVDKALSRGAKDYIVKPFDADDFLEVIKRILT